jgi:imidazolonepropionase-like amidohydrolase
MATGKALHIHAARLITGRGNEVIEDAAVRVEGGRIAAAGPASEVPAPPEGAPDVDVVTYAGGTILPGLVDAHVHLTFRRGETTTQHMARVSDEQALLRGVQAARQILAAGVTTVRDCAARGGLAQALRDGVRDGLIDGPRILASGPPVTTTTGHLWALGYESDTADECRRAVRRLVKEGVDLIKVCATGGGMTPGSNTGRAQYTTEQLRAVVDDAHRLGRHVAAHVHATEGIARAVEAGVDTLEHVSWSAEDGRRTAFDERVARQMAAQGTFANIASSAPRELAGKGAAAPGEFRAETMGAGPARARWEYARRMIQLGVQVCFSTDAIYGWYEQGHDLAYLAQVLVEHGGFAPLDVIGMITAVPARAIGLGDRVGTVEPGKLADLLVVQDNPVQDIRALHAVQAVYQDGAVV